jgi:hypothetical protein
LSTDSTGEIVLGNRLRELRDLLEDGLITMEEFEAKKRDILDRF